MNIQCVSCKGRKLCGRPFCPIIAKVSSQKKVSISLKQDFFGKTPNIFIGRHGYPDINVGILSTEQYDNHDNPLKWSRDDYSINKVIDLRSSLINSNFNANVKSFNNRLLDLSKEVGLSKKEVDIEINLNKKPTANISFQQETMPHGPSVKVKQAKITENVRVPTIVDKLTSDTDLKSTNSIAKLYEKGFDEHYITKLFSTSNLGQKTERKLVPTRWSITAIDDNIGKSLITEIRTYKTKSHKAYFGSHLGNYFLILEFPDIWFYELFEIFAGNKQPAQSFATDFENIYGRTSYASNTAGGYYASRLAVLEHLKQTKTQAASMVIRLITDEYWAPLGVWVVREATRKSASSKPLEFSSEELMLNWATLYLKKHFNFNLKNIINSSQYLNQQKKQKKLFDF